MNTSVTVQSEYTVGETNVLVVVTVNATRTYRPSVNSIQVMLSQALIEVARTENENEDGPHSLYDIASGVLEYLTAHYAYLTVVTLRVIQGTTIVEFS